MVYLKCNIFVNNGVKIHQNTWTERVFPAVGLFLQHSLKSTRIHSGHNYNHLVSLLYLKLEINTDKGTDFELEGYNFSYVIRQHKGGGGMTLYVDEHKM